MKRGVPLVLTFLMGFWAVVAYFVPHPWVANPAQQFQRWYLIILAFTTVIGVGNLIMVHGEKIQRRQKGCRPQDVPLGAALDDQDAPGKRPVIGAAVAAAVSRTRFVATEKEAVRLERQS